MAANTDVESRVSELERRLTEVERILGEEAHPANQQSKRLSIREFLISKGPKTDLDRALLIGYYLENFGNKAPFNLNDLREAFAGAKEPLPSNLSDTVNKNIQKGLVMEVPGRKDGFKSWVLTNSGEAKVASFQSSGG